MLSTGTNWPRRTHSAACGGNTAPNGRSLPGQRVQACPSTSYTRARSFAHASRYGTRSAGSNFCDPNQLPCTATRPTGTTFGRSRAAGASTPNARTATLH